MTGERHVVFDIVGTCISYDAFFNTLEQRFGEKLRQRGIQPRIFGLLVLEGGERECLFGQIAGNPIPFMTIAKPVFYRLLAMSGIEDTRKFASEEDVEYVTESYRKLGARQGVHECIARLRSAGFTVWALTSGDKARVSNYLLSAGIDIPTENFLACEEIGNTKPQPEVYEYMLDRLSGAKETWFAACHMWDATAAKRAGFKAAWCSAWEKEPMTEVFDDVDVTAQDLPGLADAVIAACVKPRTPVTAPQ